MEKHNHSSRILRAGAIEVDLDAGELRRDGRRVPLEDQPFQVLGLLIERSGKIVTRTEILQKLWPEGSLVDSDRSLDLAIGRLRQALGDTPNKEGYFEAVPDRGFRFVAKVSAGAPAWPQGAGSTPAGREVLPARRQSLLGLRASLGLIAALAAGLALAAYVTVNWPVWFEKRIKLAVLPFTNLSGKTDDEHLSDGMTDEMITRLGRMQPNRLGVIAATSVRQIKPGESIQQIGRQLGVGYIVEGSVLHEGTRVRISAKLIQVGDETQLWTNSYDRPDQDMLSIESEVAGNVAGALAPRLLPAERARLVAPDATSFEAHEAFLNGRYQWNKRTPEGFMKSIAFYEQAIAKDPNYATAYAGLADTYIMLGFYGIAKPSDSFAKSKQAASRALELDNTLAEAHATLADVKLHYDYDWKGAGEEFRRAIELNPSYATAHQWYSVYLALAGREEEGLAEIRRAREMDPLSLPINADLALNFFYARRYDRVVEQCKKTLELDPNFGLGHFHLARAYLEKKMYPEAVAEFRRAIEIQPENPLPLALLGHAYGVSGQPAKAQAIIDQLNATSAHRYLSPVFLSLVYVGLGEKDQALAWAEKAYQEHAPLLTRLKMDPIVDGLRQDPRFQDLLRRIGPPDDLRGR